MNHQETAKLLAGMQTVWKDTAADDSVLQVVMYQAALEGVSYEDAREALKRCLRELVFFPKPAEIIERLPRAAAALGEGAKSNAPRSAYDLGYLPRPATGPATGPQTQYAPRSWELPGVRTLADIVAQEEGRTVEPVLALVDGERM